MRRVHEASTYRTLLRSWYGIELYWICGWLLTLKVPLLSGQEEAYRCELLGAQMMA